MQHILGWLVQNTLVVALLVPVVLLVGRLWRFRPANQHLLWLLMLVKLLTPPLVNWPLPFGLPVVAQADPAALTSPAMPTESAATDALVAFEPSGPWWPADDAPPLAAPSEAAITVSVLPPPTPSQLEFSKLLPIALLGVWLTGAAPMCMWIAWQLLVQARILGRAKPPAKAFESWVSSFGCDLGLSSVRIRMSGDVVSPFISCLGPPTLVWPTSMTKAEELSRWQPVLAHELAHLARRDHWVMWLELLALPLLWFHPLMWFLRRRLEETRELACDALALESAEIDRGGFAELLLTLSSPKQATLSPAAPLAAGIGSAFHRRLAMLFCDRASGRISLAGLLVAGLFAAAALPGWAQTTDDPKPKTKPPTPAKVDSDPATAIEPAAPELPAAANRDNEEGSKQVRPGTIGEVTEIKEDLLHIQIAEGKSLPGNATVFVIRITPTHSEMIGGLRIMAVKGREVVAKLEPRVGKPQVGDQLWPIARTTEPRTSRSTLYGTNSTLTPAATPPTAALPLPALAPAPVPLTAAPYVPSATTPTYPVPAYAPPLAGNVPNTTQHQPTLWASLHEGRSVFQLEDGSKIIASLGEDGALHMFLEKDGKRQELSKLKDTVRTSRTPTPRLPEASSGSSTAPTIPNLTRPRASGEPPTSYPLPHPTPAPVLAPQGVSPRRAQLIEADLELAKIEVDEKQILLSQAEEKAKKGELSPIEVKLKELELRKAQIRLKQVQLQCDDSQPSAPPAGR